MPSFTSKTRRPGGTGNGYGLAWITDGEPSVTPDPRTPAADLTYRAAQAITQGVEVCYTPETIRAIAVAYESGPEAAAQAMAAERKLKNHFKGELNLTPFRRLIRQFRTELVSDTGSSQSSKNGYILTLTGGIRGNLANAITMLRHLPIAYDSFASRTGRGRRIPWKSTGVWTDNDDIKAAEWCQHRDLDINSGLLLRRLWGQLHTKNRFIRCAIIFEPLGVGRRTAPRPLALQIPRLPRRSVRAQRRRQMDDSRRAACHGARLPGGRHSWCQRSKQGKRKSTALRVLGGKWFTDDLADIGTKDSGDATARQVDCRGIGTRRIPAKLDMTTIKAWLVRRHRQFPATLRAPDR